MQIITVYPKKPEMMENINEITCVSFLQQEVQFTKNLQLNRILSLLESHKYVAINLHNVLSVKNSIFHSIATLLIEL